VRDDATNNRHFTVQAGVASTAVTDASMDRYNVWLLPATAPATAPGAMVRAKGPLYRPTRP
jgi:hypothetical protein